MSESTPGGMMEHEPSMEDILASIRKVIAEDAPAVAADTAAEYSDMSTTAAIADLSFEDDATVDFDLTQDLLSDDQVPDLELGDIDDSSTQALLETSDFDLSDMLDDASIDDVTEVAATGMAALEQPQITPPEDVLDLTDMLTDADVALSGDGSAVPDMPELPAEEPEAEQTFDEMMDLVLNDDLDAMPDASEFTAQGDLQTSDLDAILGDIDALAESDFTADLENIDLGETPLDQEALDALGITDLPNEDVVSSVLDIDETALELPVKDEHMNSIAGKLAALGGFGAAAVGAGALAKDTSSDVSDVEALELTETVEEDYVPEAEQVLDPAEALLSAGVSDTTSGGDEDIDLVKSLMAELTDDTFEESSDDGFTLDSADELDDIFEIALEDEDGDLGGLVATNASGAFSGSEPEAPGDDLAAIIAEANAEAEAAAAQQASLTGDVVEAEADIAYDAPELDTDFESSDELEDSDIMAGVTGALAGAAAVAGGAAFLSDDEQDLDELMAEDDVDLEALLAPEQNDDSVIETEADSKASLDATETELQTEDEPMPKLVQSETVSSEDTATAASDAFASLNKVVEEKTVESESGPRIGDLVQAALKPMLQEWLDKNLKGIVDRAVAKEIKRISSGK